jgi:tetratricopeptide (TPR) repeat protein
LAIAYIHLGKFSEAVLAFEKANELGWRTWQYEMEDITFFIDAYLKAKRYNHTLVLLYEAAIAKNPNDLQLYTSLAVLLRDLGRYDDARQVAAKVLAIDPLLKPDVEAFLETFRGK